MQGSALHDRPDRADGGHNDRRPEFPDGAGQERLTGEAGGSAGFRIEPIYRIRACIDQVTARGLERCKKISIGMRRLHQVEGVANSTIEAGIAAVEESTGGRRSLSDEEQSETVRQVATPKLLARAQG